MGCGSSIAFHHRSHPEISVKPSILYEIEPDSTYEDISLKSMIFKHVMTDPVGRQFFREYLQKEHAEENIMFYEAVEGIKISTNDEFPPRVLFLTEEFLFPGVDCEVNISDHMKKSLINLAKQADLLEKKPDYIRLVTKAQYEISIILSLGAFPRFLKSTIFRDYRAVLKNKKANKSISRRRAEPVERKNVKRQ